MKLQRQEGEGLGAEDQDKERSQWADLGPASYLLEPVRAFRHENNVLKLGEEG